MKVIPYNQATAHKAQNAGYAARVRGAKESSNPNAKGTLQHECWQSGWEIADSHIKHPMSNIISY
jgi:hypothetical protein